MNTTQYDKIIDLLCSIKTTGYTLTGASDWPIFVWVFGALSGLLSCLLIYIWRDLISIINDNRDVCSEKIDEERVERKEQIQFIWEELRGCQDDCCPRGKE